MRRLRRVCAGAVSRTSHQSCSHAHLSQSPFFDFCLRVVHYIDLSSRLGMASQDPVVVPIRGRLCSAECYVADGHDYLGLLQPL